MYGQVRANSSTISRTGIGGGGTRLVALLSVRALFKWRSEALWRQPLCATNSTLTPSGALTKAILTAPPRGSMANSAPLAFSSRTAAFISSTRNPM